MTSTAIKELHPNADAIIKNAKCITSRFPLALDGLFIVNEKINIRTNSKLIKVTGKVRRVKRVGNYIDVTFDISKRRVRVKKK